MERGGNEGQKSLTVVLKNLAGKNAINNIEEEEEKEYHGDEYVCFLLFLSCL